MVGGVLVLVAHDALLVERDGEGHAQHLETTGEAAGDPVDGTETGGEPRMADGRDPAMTGKTGKTPGTLGATGPGISSGDRGNAIATAPNR